MTKEYLANLSLWKHCTTPVVCERDITDDTSIAKLSHGLSAWAALIRNKGALPYRRLTIQAALIIYDVIYFFILG